MTDIGYTYGPPAISAPIDPVNPLEASSALALGVAFLLSVWSLL